MKSLIITADDFGFTPSLNAAVVRAHRAGILGYASLMVDGPAAGEAAALARGLPALGVGLHLDLCRSQPELWGLRCFFSASQRRLAAAEIRRQIEALLSLGLKPTHADGHLNVQAHPAVFPALARACREYGIPRLRLPGGEWSACARFMGARAAGAAPLAAVFWALGALLRPSAGGLVVPRACFGLLRSGLMTQDYLLALLDGVEEGLTEVYVHPCDDPASAVTDRPTPTHHTISELEALLSPRLRRRLEELRIRLHSPATPAARA